MTINQSAITKDRRHVDASENLYQSAMQKYMKSSGESEQA